MAHSLSDSNFKQLIFEADKPVVVDFWATWCGPCRMISPIVDKLAEKYEGRVNVYKCNVDECSDAPMQFGVRNIPAIFFVKGGEIVGRQVGAVSQAQLESKIEELLK